MKKYLLTICVILTVSNLLSQTVFWSENFGVGCNQGQPLTGYSGWSVSGTTTSSGDNFFVSATEAGMGSGNCSDGCLSIPSLNNRTLHVSLNANPSPTAICPAGDCSAIYNAKSYAMILAETTTINCVGKSGLSLSFDFIHYGDGALDFAEVLVYCPTSGPLSLPTWQTMGILPKSTCANAACTSTAPCTGLSKAIWATYSLNLPSGANNYMYLRIGFRWNNNGDNVGIDPSVAIDNINLSAALITNVENVNALEHVYKIYPNPAEDVVYIETEVKELNLVKVEVIDVLGRTVIIGDKKFGVGQNVQPINIRELNRGIYFIKIISDDKQSSLVKIIKE